MQAKDFLNAEIQKWEYLTHWIQIDQLAKQCTPKRPLKKMKIFKRELFDKKHEAIYNRLYFQKMILIGVAAQLKLKLLLSRNLYERDGLVYGVYRFQIPNEPSRKLSGIEFIEQFSVQMDFDGLYKWFDEPLKDMIGFIEKTKFSDKDQYIHWKKGIIKFLQESSGNFTPYQFLSSLSKLPLNEHYVFRVKLQNAMLTPIFLKGSQISKQQMGSTMKQEQSENKEVKIPPSKQQYKKWVLWEKKILQQIFNDPDSLQEKFKELQKIRNQIFKTLFENQKIGQADEGPPFFRDINKKSKKQTTLMTLQRKFAIILSQYRGIIVTKQQIPESMEQKDANSWTKIEIKARNGSIEPISGNLIFLKLSWSLSCEDKQTKLLLQCCNNRKVQEMYYEDVYSFWEKLQANEKFRDLIGVDKFMISLNDDQDNLEVVISNYVPACLLTNSLKQIDKIVVLTLVLDQVIEICEKKGSEKQDLKNLAIEPYMIEHAIMRFEKAIKEVENHSDILYKDIEYQLRFHY